MSGLPGRTAEQRRKSKDGFASARGGYVTGQRSGAHAHEEQQIPTERTTSGNGKQRFDAARLRTDPSQRVADPQGPLRRRGSAGGRRMNGSCRIRSKLLSSAEPGDLGMMETAHRIWYSVHVAVACSGLLRLVQACSGLLRGNAPNPSVGKKIPSAVSCAERRRPRLVRVQNKAYAHCLTIAFRPELISASRSRGDQGL